MSCASVPSASSLNNFPAEARGWLAAQEGENLWKRSRESSLGYFDLSAILWMRTGLAAHLTGKSSKPPQLLLSLLSQVQEWSGKCFSLFSDLQLPSGWCTDPGCRYKLTAQCPSFISNYIAGGDHNSLIGRHITYISPINAHSCPLLSELFVFPFLFSTRSRRPTSFIGFNNKNKSTLSTTHPHSRPYFWEDSPSISYLKWPYRQMQPWACCVCVLVYVSC